MRVLIRYFGGFERPAITLTVSGTVLRMASPGCEDVLELRWAGGGWRTASGEPVEIEFDPEDEAFYRALPSSSAAPWLETAPFPQWTPSASAGAVPRSVN